MENICFSSWQDQVVDNRNQKDGNFIKAKNVELPDFFNEDEQIKGFIGADGLVIKDHKINVVELCRAYANAFYSESCGKCIPCRTGSQNLKNIFEKICLGQAKESDLEKINDICELLILTSKCGIGQTSPIAFLHALKYFYNDFIAALNNKTKIPTGKYHYYVTAPCMQACPIHTNIPLYVEAIKESKPFKSCDIIREKLPMPGCLGRTCVRFCEDNCRRANIDEPISIKALKRYAADREIFFNKAPDYKVTPSAKKGKVAIVGAGPSGLTCAYHLGLKDHAVDIYEAFDKPGGMATFGIPDYRLPPNILQKEVDDILKLGVKINYKTLVGKDIAFTKLIDDYDAVFIAIGAQNSMNMGLIGEDKAYEGFINGTDYLYAINNGKDLCPIGQKVVVVGGGNVAIDCVRSCLRIGKTDVNLVYRRSEKQMPADNVEILDAKEEKVKFNFLTNPVKIIEKDNKVIGVECIKMELGEPDESGRQRPIPIKGSEFIIDCDMVIPAIGNTIDLLLLKDFSEIKTTKWHTIIVDPITKQTSHKKIFSAGDCENGPDTLISACAGGYKAAISIDRLINNLDLKKDRNEEFFEKVLEKLNLYNKDGIINLPINKKRKNMDMLLPEVRKKLFDEVEQGFTVKDAISEAKRCLRCYQIFMVAV